MYKEINKHIQQLLQEKTGDIESLTFQEFIDKLKISTETYMLSIRSSLNKPKIFLKRELSDRYTNSYMKNMLSAWKANHDIQFVLDAYSCVVYICDYMTKSQKGMSNLLASACQEAKKGNMTLTQSVRHMGNKFINGVETSE